MKFEKILNFILERLHEGPTWAAICGLISAFGLNLSSEQVITITSIAMALLPNKIDLNKDGIAEK